MRQMVPNSCGGGAREPMFFCHVRGTSSKKWTNKWDKRKKSVGFAETVDRPLFERFSNYQIITCQNVVFMDTQGGHWTYRTMGIELHLILRPHAACGIIELSPYSETPSPLPRSIFFVSTNTNAPKHNFRVNQMLISIGNIVNNCRNSQKNRYAVQLLSRTLDYDTAWMNVFSQSVPECLNCTNV